MNADELSDVRALQDAFDEYESLRVAVLGEVTCLEERMEQAGWETAPSDEFEPTRLKLERYLELREEMAEIVARMAERRGVPLDEVRRNLLLHGLNGGVGSAFRTNVGRPFSGGLPSLGRRR